jgi:hypothetical protein
MALQSPRLQSRGFGFDGLCTSSRDTQLGNSGLLSASELDSVVLELASDPESSLLMISRAHDRTLWI